MVKISSHRIAMSGVLEDAFRLLGLTGYLDRWFAVVFAGLAGVCAVFYYYVQHSADKSSAITEATPEFQAFQRSYLIVYVVGEGGFSFSVFSSLICSVVMLSDWLQGPYVYALYHEYGFSAAQIAQLFVAGFSSSMVAGTFAGGVADKWGRKRGALAFCVVYGLSCISKLYNSFEVLLVGRLLAGVATSLLFSVFEAWMVSEHQARSFPEPGLGQTFAR